MTTTAPWINRTGRAWGLAHVMQADSEHEFLGALYAKTLCGRTVHADSIVAAGTEARCKACTMRGRRVAALVPVTLAESSDPTPNTNPDPTAEETK